ncbi:Sortase A, LPXTG specific [Fructilactobacillus florum 8D]|uniref:Sortase A, LPXTG specific n=2 Tax=Fructilactobacillus florum TaxID=640331 RepID=W9EGG3_9LACO|nr:class A sortase [Fructilactobacillus florum]ETO40346.1 Sortase A, LPXTG specific [Fructilactobacillus florum 8D]
MKRKQQHHWVRRILKDLLITILLLIGLGLVFNSQLQSWWISHQSQQKVEKISHAEVKRGQQQRAEYKYENVKAVSDDSFLESQKAKQTAAIGKISIPELNIELPIFKGLNTQNLTIGAGTMKASQKMGQGNYTLAGHHMKDPNVLFSPLSRAKKGQMVTITNLKHDYRYQISQIKVVPETDVSVLDDHPNQKLLTLVTCASGNPGETRRLIVTAKLIE